MSRKKGLHSQFVLAYKSFKIFYGLLLNFFLVLNGRIGCFNQGFAVLTEYLSANQKVLVLPAHTQVKKRKTKRHYNDEFKKESAIKPIM